MEQVASDVVKTNYVKILNKNLLHKGFQYKEGLNVDKNPIDKRFDVDSKGLHFTDFANFHKFLTYGMLITDVEVSEGTEIYKDKTGTKYKAERIIISNIRQIKHLPEWNNLEFCLKAVEASPVALQYVVNFTDENYISIVRKDGLLLQYIPCPNRTAEICLEAVRQNGLSLEFVPNNFTVNIYQEICLDAVQQNGLALEYIDCDDFHKILDADKDSVINEKCTEDDIYDSSEGYKMYNYVCFKAVQQDGLALEFVSSESVTVELCLAAVQQNGHALQFVPDKMQTKKVCLAAVQQTDDALILVPDKLRNEQIILAAVQQNGLQLANISDKLRNDRIYLAAVQQNGLALKYISELLQTKEICLEAVNQNAEAFKYVSNKLINIKVDAGTIIVKFK
jgi:hypothetical protein